MPARYRHRGIAAVLFAAAMLAAALIAAPSRADGLLEMTVDTVGANQGYRTETAVRLENAEGLEAIRLTVRYDPAALTLEEATAGDMIGSDGVTEINAYDSGSVQFAFACPYGLQEGSGELLTLSFTLTSETGSAVTVSDCQAWKYTRENGEERMYLTLTNGGVYAEPNGSVPAPAYSTWVPETPTPSPVPTETPVPAEPETPEMSPAPHAVPFGNDPEALRETILKAGIALAALLVVLVAVYVVLRIRGRGRDD